MAGDDETQVVVPAYALDDLVLGGKDIAGGTGTRDFKNNPIIWMDLNIDARAWAKEAT